MPSLLSGAFRLKNSPYLLKLPPYLSALCIIVGIVWVLLLPLDEYSRRTYISENALLPGQVHTYFGGSDQNVFRAYKHEVNALVDSGANNTVVNDKIAEILSGIGLKTARQGFKYSRSSAHVQGENIYAILSAPRGDATEAIVLVAPWRNARDELNKNGVTLLLTLARYFRRWSLWSKDIILLVTPDSAAGPQAWVDAYHDSHGAGVSSLPVKSGALQGAVVIDYVKEDRFKSVHVAYDGVNGALPNLDLFNSVVSIAGGQMGMGVGLQEMWAHGDRYQDRLETMLRGMLKQGLGSASGAHSCFIPYHVDAVTLRPYGDGWQDEMALGRVIEGTFRSLNNLLEKLHQSFFFFLLMSTERFVSIGTYLPSAMLVAVNFTFTSIALWIKSGMPAGEVVPGMEGKKAEKEMGRLAVERDLFLPLGVVIVCQAMGVVPLWLFNHTPEQLLAPVFAIFLVFNLILPYGLSTFLRTYSPTAQQYQLIMSFSLLLLGMILSTLATLNFSLSLLVGLLATPLSFVRPGARLWSVPLALVSPPAVLAIVSASLGHGGLAAVGEVLRGAAFGWNVMGMYTPVVVWCVWWPAWLVGSLAVLGRPSTGKAKTA